MKKSIFKTATTEKVRVFQPIITKNFVGNQINSWTIKTSAKLNLFSQLDKIFTYYFMTHHHFIAVWFFIRPNPIHYPFFFHLKVGL